MPGDERRAPGGAALLPIPIGKPRAFFGDAVDVGRLITHDATVVAARIEPPDVIAHDDEDVWFLSGRWSRRLRVRGENANRREAERSKQQFCFHNRGMRLG